MLDRWLPNFPIKLLLLAAAALDLVSCARPKTDTSVIRSSVPSTQSITFISGDSNGKFLAVIEPNQSQFNWFLQNEPRSSWPTFSRNGSTMIYAEADSESDASHIYGLMGASGKRIRLTDKPTFDIAPALSTDEHAILFTRANWLRGYSMGGTKWDHWDLWLMNADGSSQRPLTNLKFYSMGAAYFCQDGHTIIFAGQPGGSDVESHIYTMAFDSRTGSAGPPHRLTIGAPSRGDWDSDPRPVPDSNQIVFVSRGSVTNRLFDYEIWTANLDGTNPTQLSNMPWLNYSPLSASDGKSIYFVNQDELSAPLYLCTVGRDGRGAQQIKQLTK